MSVFNKHILGFGIASMVLMTIIDRNATASLFGFAAILWMASAFKLEYTVKELKAKLLVANQQKDKDKYAA